MKKELKAGMRLKLVRGSNGSDVARWYAGEVYVGSKGVVYVEKNGCPAIKFDGIEPKDGLYFGLTSDCLYNDRHEMFEEVTK